jgi:hypothetical protein
MLHIINHSEDNETCQIERQRPKAEPRAASLLDGFWDEYLRV